MYLYLMNIDVILLLYIHFSAGTVSGSGTGPLDYGATGPVPDSYTLILGVRYRTPSHTYEDCLGVR